jgi:rhodanese-related sulfurtransferase
MLLKRSGMSSEREAGLESGRTTVWFSDLKYTAVYETVHEGGYVAWLEEMRGVQT